MRVHDPLPDEAGDDEGQREGIEQDRAEGALEADLLVHQHGEEEAETIVKTIERTPKITRLSTEMFQRVGLEQALVLGKADEVVLGQEPASW